MRLWPAWFAFALLASGCTSVRVDEASASSVTCVDGACEVCVDGQCAPCDEDACADCRDGDCPELAGAANAPPPAPLPDVSIQETHDLTFGLEPTSWTFEVADGATGHVRFVLRDLATKELTLMANACLQWTKTTETGVSKGARNCPGSGGLVVHGGTTNVGELDLLSWERLSQAHYKLTASAGRQANELVVDIVVDNPGT